jgi:hypothetical protein
VRWREFLLGYGCCGERRKPSGHNSRVEAYIRISQEVPTISAKKERIVFSTALWIARTFGWILIALAILGIPQMGFLIGRLAASFGLLSSLVLGLAGVAWLVGVQLFLDFFDRYLSRN